MLINVELHTHTKFSRDSLLGKLSYLIMLKIRKVEYIAITDHDEIQGALEYKHFLEKRGIGVIVGEEITTSKGEIIGLFLSEKIQPGMSPKETIDEIVRQSGIVYIPHPFDLKRHKSVLSETYIEENKDKISLIEVYNGRNVSPDYEVKQKEIAGRYKNILPVMGSDAHVFFELGRNTIKMPKFNDSTSFLESIKDESRVTFNKKKCLRSAHTLTKYVRLIKLISKGDFGGLYRVVRKKIRRTD